MMRSRIGRVLAAVAVVAVPGALLVACEAIEQAEESNKVLEAPVNCATAEDDLRILERERASVADRKAAGASTMASTSQIYGSGSTGGRTGYEISSQHMADQQTSLQMQMDRYQQAVEKKIAEIKKTCGL